MEIKTEIAIEATAEKVWSVLTHFGNYPAWNPFIKSIQGEVQKGNKITVRIEPPQAKGMTFKPKVLTFEPNQHFSWLGHLLFPGLFDGKHCFELIRNANGTTTFKHSENFSGLLVPLFKRLLKENTRKGFEEMNLKLKAISEKE